MDAYADYNYYTDNYGGSAIAQDSFDRLAERASREVYMLTFGRAEPVIDAGEAVATIDAIRMATCAVADMIQDIEAGLVQSERVGQHSVTYALPTQSNQAQISAAARRYLWQTDLMFRGLDEDE